MATRTATKNQLLGQLDRSFPGMALRDVLGTKVGRLVAHRVRRPDAVDHVGFCPVREVHCRPERPAPAAGRGQAARGRADALPTADAAVARAVLAADLALLAVLDEQVTAAEQQLATLLPDSPYAALTSVPGWATVRGGNYGAAVGDPHRWPGPRQIYRASGLSPMQYESAGKRRDGSISREGSVELRRALIDLGLGLWLNDPAARAYGQALRARARRAP